MSPEILGGPRTTASIAEAIEGVLGREVSKVYSEDKIKMPTKQLNIRDLTDEQRKSLIARSSRYEVRFGFISDDPADPRPVKYYARNIGFNNWYACQAQLDGRHSFAPNLNEDLVLPQPKSVTSKPSYILINPPENGYPTSSDKHALARTYGQAQIVITDFSEVKVGEGLDGKSIRKFKLVPIE